MTVDQMTRNARLVAERYGLSVRCPTCDRGTGKWCRDDQGVVILHNERVAEAQRIAAIERFLRR